MLQFDWYGWIPNSPSTMRKPPPKQKGTVDMKFIMESLPDRGCSSKALGTVWALSRFQKKEVWCLIWIENMTAVYGAINVEHCSDAIGFSLFSWM